MLKKIRLLGEDIQKRLGSITSLMVEIISGVTDMKLFKMGQVVTKRYFRQNEVLTNQIIKRISKLSQVEAINFFWSSFNFLGILIIGLIMIKSGKTDLSTVIAVITLQNNITFMFLNIGIFVNNIQSALASTNVILTVLNEEPESNSEENKDVSHIATYTQEMISLNNVSFSYDNKKSILSNANLNINEGENIVVIGPSGCGKTTLFKLLMGFYKKTAGEIIINHKEISNYTLGDLRNITAYVSQDAFMFEGTIRENIQFGKMNATDTEIIKAAQMANAHNFIMELPEGYNTRIGINGMGLSGGQKQRIAIARAILKDAPILLLDEATAALDSENEDIVQHALNVLMKGKTVITIAHKLQTIQNADNVYMLKDGTFEAQCISKLQTN
ncbi:ABC transporter ATP-binding protein [Cellulosilyticum ruminicola]|uniref:ABC transporter ATP-binding protein n=1 Tax=Cellulosilyticum ruminicola TaxID=425254 RepID=UPI0006D21C48|nr:ABC transporter ATP-binding protein [Cellulosilyticum ruminicola]